MTTRRPDTDGVLRVAVAARPEGLDPAQSPRPPARNVLDLVYSTLTRLDADGSPGPGLADRWVTAPDGLEWTFHLRQGVAFHNGSPLTADDVAASLLRIRHRERDYGFWAWVEAIDAVDAPDPRTVRIRLTRPSSPLPVWLAFAGVAVLPRAALDAGHDFEAAPLGSGPFRWGAQTGGEVVRLERADATDGRATPTLGAIEYHVIPSSADRVQALVEDAVDFADAIAPEDWASVPDDPEVVRAPILDARFHWLMLNTTIDPLDRPLVREALGHALDRRAIADGVFLGQAEPILGGWLPAWSWAHDPSLRHFDERANPERARSLLRQAGVADGLSLTIRVGAGIPMAAAQAEVIADNLRDVGVKAAVEVLEQERYLSDVWRDRQFEASVMCWASPLNDPDDFVGGQFRWGPRNNVEEYHGSELIDAINGAVETVDPGARRLRYQEIQARLLTECPRIPTVFPTLLRAHRRRVEGYRPLRNGRLGSLSDVRLPS